MWKRNKMTAPKAGKTTFPEECKQSIRGTPPETNYSTSGNKPHELSDRFCDLCVEDGQSTTANIYCRECEQRLCERCLKSHQRGTFTRDHVTVLDSDFGHRTTTEVNKRGASQAIKVGEKHTLSKADKETVEVEGQKRRGKWALFAGELQVTERTGEDTAIVCAMEFLQEGQVVVCDSGNNKIKLFDTNGKLTSSITLTSKPGGLALLSDTSLMWSLPLEKCLQLGTIDNGNQLKLVSTADTSKRYYRLISYQTNTIVHAEDDTHRFIFIMDKTGREIQRIVTDAKGTDEKFSVIRYMCKSPRYKAVYLTGNKLGCTCISMDGEIIATYEEANSRSHWGVCCDNDGDVFVSCPDQHKVIILDSKGEKIKDLIVSKGMDPGFIAYDQHSNKIYVWSDQKKLVLVYKIDVGK